MPLPHSATESLFRACTEIKLGNGCRSKFWSDNWMQGENPRDIAPSLYALARRKSLTVADSLHDGRWIRGLQRVTTTEEINQFVDLWLRVRQTHLTDQDDELTRKFSANGAYSAKSAYNIQIVGTFAEFGWADLWKAKTENKCKFLNWLLLQNKVWSADQIIKFGGQTNPICQLCRTQPESVMHMLTECSYAKAVWQALQLWIGVDLQQPPVKQLSQIADLVEYHGPYSGPWQGGKSATTTESSIYCMEYLEGEMQAGFRQPGNASKPTVTSDQR
jgi:hypothetical protein